MLGRKSEANMLYSIFVFMLKALCHIFATSYIKLAIFLRREDLIKFWVDFQEIIKLSDQLGIYPPEKSIGKLGKDFIAGIVLCILFIADMWEGYLLNPNRGDGAAGKCKMTCKKYACFAKNLIKFAKLKILKYRCDFQKKSFHKFL